MAVINGWVFLRLPRTLTGIRSRQGSLYTASSLNGYLILLFETFRLTTDIQVFDRERNEGIVGVLSFLLSRRVARLPLEDLPVPILFSVIFYMMVGYRLEVAEFFIFLGVNILTHLIAVTFAASMFVPPISSGQLSFRTDKWVFVQSASAFPATSPEQV
jgi:hypothetical protein